MTVIVAHTFMRRLLGESVLITHTLSECSSYTTSRWCLMRWQYGCLNASSGHFCFRNCIWFRDLSHSLCSKRFRLLRFRCPEIHMDYFLYDTACVWILPGKLGMWLFACVQRHRTGVGIRLRSMLRSVPSVAWSTALATLSISLYI